MMRKQNSKNQFNERNEQKGPNFPVKNKVNIK